MNREIVNFLNHILFSDLVVDHFAMIGYFSFKFKGVHYCFGVCVETCNNIHTEQSVFINKILDGLPNIFEGRILAFKLHAQDSCL